MSDTKRASLDDLKQMHARGEISAPGKDAAQIDLPEGFWDDAVLEEKPTKKSVHLRVDADIYEFFKAQGKGHLTRMNAVLRAYVTAQKGGLE